MNRENKNIALNDGEPLTSGFASGGLYAPIQNFGIFESWCFGSKFTVKIRPSPIFQPL